MDTDLFNYLISIALLLLARDMLFKLPTAKRRQPAGSKGIEACRTNHPPGIGKSTK